MTSRVYLPFATPSQTALTVKAGRTAEATIAAARTGRRLYNRLRDDTFMVARGAIASGDATPAAGRRRIFVTRYVQSSRRFVRDYGNLIGGAKPVLDGLRKAGLLIDDSEKWLDERHAAAYRQETGPREGTVIVLEDC